MRGRQLHRPERAAIAVKLGNLAAINGSGSGHSIAEYYQADTTPWYMGPNLTGALERVEDVLAEQRVFILSPEKWEAFVAALDAPPRDLPELRKLMATPGPFDPPKSGS